MKTYYTKGEDGEFSEATGDELDKMFTHRRNRWAETESQKIRESTEASIRDELTKSISDQFEEKIKTEYQPKLDEATATVSQLQTTLRQKTIAAEYGFKPGTEKYLGNGTEDDMRKEADTLKNSFTAGAKAPEKETSTGKSSIQKRTGIEVTI